MRLLHAGANLLRNRHARGGAGRLPELRHRRSDRRYIADRRRDPRADERQSLPLRRLCEHRRGDPGGGIVTPFEYRRAADAASAVAAVSGRPGAAFLGGGTNLVDHMKLGIAGPDLLVDVTRLPLGGIEE